MMMLVPCQMQTLDLVGGATMSIFPRAESWLLADSDHQHGLEYVARRKNQERYHSMMDFLFCELFVKYRQDCFRYYEGKGPLLKEMISREEIKWCDAILLKALKTAHQAFCKQRKMTWTSFRQEVLGAAA